MNEETLRRFRQCFASMAVYKDLKKTSFFETLALPSFMRDWLLQKYEDENGEFSTDELRDFVKTFIPKHDDWTAIKDRLVINYEKVKILAKIKVDINIVTGDVSFELPDFGLGTKDTIIESDVWEKCKSQLLSGHDTWGMLELGYRLPNGNTKSKGSGKIRLLSFRSFCPYEINLDYYKEVRKEFTIQEWMDILLGAIDYNADGYAVAKAKNDELPDAETMKLTMLSRLMPFAEKKLNLIELAPMGTGKSYLFGHLSRYGWLSTSDKMTRAKLFYDLSKHTEGLIAQNDFVVLDEVQKTEFEDGIAATLQGYMDSDGSFTVGNVNTVASAGLVLLGNIAPSIMKADGFEYMFAKLPHIFHDAAMIDRFQGFIKGWNIPRMNEDLKVCGWALNSEYFTSILHEMREDISYRVVVDELIEMPEGSGSDTRHSKGVKRIATALLKLLFPNVQHPQDISHSDFVRYCFKPAMQMRYTLLYQMGLMNEQYRGKNMPDFKVRRND